MIENTLMIFGPGGIGKSPIDDIMKPEVSKIDPYRLRERPRDRDENSGTPDMFYANPKLRSELLWAFKTLGDSKKTFPNEPAVEWFSKARVAFFDVCGEWQCLLLGGLEAQLAKAEIFGPAFVELFSLPDVQEIFGKLSIVILNPVESLRNLNGNYETLKNATKDNCQKAGRSEKDIAKRVKSIDDPKAHEAESWLAMLDMGGIEFTNWPFPEYVYKGNRVQKLIEMRNTLVKRSSDLERFLMTEDEIRRKPAESEIICTRDTGFELKTKNHELKIRSTNFSINIILLPNA